MVAVIGSGVSIRRTFLYNENKVKEGVAECLMASAYPMDLEQMDERQRLNMLLKTAALNPDVKRSSIHISLNFAPGEQLSDATLKEIASDYMARIGFKDQPFLLYRHDDAAHPHLHIVTTKIRPDGSRIVTQNIGKNLSEPARKAIENKYGLVKAEQQKEQSFALKPVNASKVIYGEQPTKKAISAVLQSVLQGYKYTSLPELNAVLNQYNITADSGTEGSRIFQHRGLVYHLLDAKGSPVGVPVKASSLYNNPGLKFLEKQYLKNELSRQQHKDRVKNAVDLILLRNPQLSLEQLAQKLKTEGIHLAVRKNAEGFIYGLTYVDHRTKCVFNGSTLGKKYSAKGIGERLPATGIPVPPAFRQSPLPQPNDQRSPSTMPDLPSKPAGPSVDKSGSDNSSSMLENLMQPEHADQHIPYGWRKKKRRRKKR